MREFLVPIFGEWGAVIAQFLLTVIIVLGLIGAVWWFVRRYSGVQFGGIGRGRVPRLAIIDVVPVDRRRRLVLVRRDNVEHLLLLGGPSDLLVEGAIQRVRQRGAQQAAQVAAARAAMQSALETQPEQAQIEAQQPRAAAAEMPEQPPASDPIPFPASRSAPTQPSPGQAAAGNGRSLFRALHQPAAPEPPAEEPQAPTARFVEPQRPSRLQALRSRPVAAPQEASPPDLPEDELAQHQPHAVAEEAGDQVLLSEVMTAETESPPPPAQPMPATFAEAEREAAEAARQAAFDLGDIEADTEAPAAASAQAASYGAEPAQEEHPAPPETAAKVSDLEREMARLLDEITTRRSS